ncbi:MAG: hypothetical protein ACHQ3P_00465 [Candidatus Limnocylindrales bacterium]
MSIIAESTTQPPSRPRAGAGVAGAYTPGVCNIGPAEIARRRRAGHVGALLTVGLLIVLVAVDAPPLVRLVVALPASVTAISYLQAWLRFCAGFGSRGIFNFGDLGQTEMVANEEDRARDRSRATRIGVAGGAIGLAVGILAELLPL